jgi:hypothetical protein
MPKVPCPTNTLAVAMLVEGSITETVRYEHVRIHDVGVFPRPGDGNPNGTSPHRGCGRHGKGVVVVPITEILSERLSANVSVPPPQPMRRRAIRRQGDQVGASWDRQQPRIMSQDGPAPNHHMTNDAFQRVGV